jgi:DNA-binding MarR family transcriptional regulator
VQHPVAVAGRCLGLRDARLDAVGDVVDPLKLACVDAGPRVDNPEAVAHSAPDLDVSPVGVFGRISRIDRHKSIALRDVYQRHDCDAGEYDVLAALRRSGPPHVLTPTELSRTVPVNSATMTERLTRLEQRGLVPRTRSDRDRRSVTVGLTRAGRTLIDRAVKDLLALQTRLLDCLTQADQRALARLLAKLAADLDAQEISARGVHARRGRDDT